MAQRKYICKIGQEEARKKGGFVDILTSIRCITHIIWLSEDTHVNLDKKFKKRGGFEDTLTPTAHAA